MQFRRRGLIAAIATAALSAAACTSLDAAPPTIAPPPSTSDGGLGPLPPAINRELLMTPSACVSRDLALTPGPIGALWLEEAFVLEPGGRGFGGLSALANRGPSRLLAVTDQGRIVELVRWDLETSNERRVSCIIRDLADRDGLLEGRRADSEGAAWLDDETLLVSFERIPRVQAFTVGPADAALPDPVRAAGPPIDFEGQGLDDNESLEALAVLPSGALLAGAETPTLLGRPHPVWRLAPTGDPAAPFETPGDPAFQIATEAGYGLVELAVTPQDGLIVLERFFTEATGPRIRIGWLPPGVAETASDVVRPITLARLHGEDGVPVDNFEGALALPGPDGLTTLWIVSDDNFSSSQRTLLYRFLFDEAALR